MFTSSDNEVISEAVEAVCTQLGMVVGHDLSFDAVQSERATARVAGQGRIHVSFRLGFHKGGLERFGCLLLPLPEAISLASFLLMVPKDAVECQRDSTELDDTLKDALLEIGNFIGGALASVLREHEDWGCSVRTRGCQGVRADVRPAFPYEEGSPLLVGRCQARVGDFPAFELILMLPVFPQAARTAV